MINLDSTFNETYDELNSLTEDLDPIDQLLFETSAIELNFNGFDRDAFQDKFDPNSGHYTVDWTNHYGDFTYEVSAVSIFEKLRDEIIPKHMSKFEGNEIVDKFKILYQNWEASTKETEEETCSKMEMYLAENLDEFVEIFNEQLLEEYEENAEEWAYDHMEPEDYYPEYED